MGQLFCFRKVNDEHSTLSQSLLQINRYMNNNNVSNYKILLSRDQNRIKNIKENLVSRKSKYNMIYYDINKKEAIIMKRKLEGILSLEGLSELNINNKLYICGSSSQDPETDKGSHLFELNPLNPKTRNLLFSKYCHYYPALIAIKNRYIYCIGGQSQFHCESYDIKENVWLPLPNLPEERYLCTLCYDEMKNIIYLFGGINEKNRIHKHKFSIEYDYFLRLIEDEDIGLKWQKINIKNNKSLINRFSAGSLIFEGQENYIYILGGKDEQGFLLDDIIRFDIEKQSFQNTNKIMPFPTEFFNQYSLVSEIDKFLYVFLDKYNNPIKIDKHEFLDINFEEL